MEIKAIDFHVHPQTAGAVEAQGARSAQMARYFGRERAVTSWEAMADMFRERQMMAVLQNNTDEGAGGRPGCSGRGRAGARGRGPGGGGAGGGGEPGGGRGAGGGGK